MEILINELSLTGQFTSVEKFIKDALPPLISLLKEVHPDKDLLYKKRDFYSSLITIDISIHNLLIGKYSRNYDELRKFKSQLFSLFAEPHWENSQKHLSTDMYVYNGSNVCGQSIAEACERDRVIISFTHQDFSVIQIQVEKNRVPVEVDNLFTKGHYTELAYKREQIDYEQYFSWQFDNKKCLFVHNTKRFSGTNYIEQGQRIYREIQTGNYWYLDNLHKGHYEVFNADKEHIGVANLNGVLDTTKKKNGRKIDL
ncbi:MAG: hypothetical protein LBQ31_08325 [Bacteroidales bacterium]|jgi:hypothetical protein|nr:hypothetical protein [Bacteroidales bacterium]